jgi:REP element-mobilizing transposase RayT
MKVLLIYVLDKILYEIMRKLNFCINSVQILAEHFKLSLTVEPRTDVLAFCSIQSFSGILPQS